MPRIQCAHCKRLQQVGVRLMKYLSPIKEDYLCSMKCVMEKVMSYKMPKHAMAKAWVLSRSRGSEAYSSTLDMYFRSKYEKYFAETVASLGIPRCNIIYEQYGFQLKDGGLYVPDFLILNRCLVEVKGQWGVGGRSKMVDFRREFPDIPFVFVHWGLHKEFYK